MAIIPVFSGIFQSVVNLLTIVPPPSGSMTPYSGIAAAVPSDALHVYPGHA
jgi:hypothetical protein